MTADVQRELAEVLDSHVTGTELVGDRQMRLICSCDEWSDEFTVHDSPSVEWSEAHARWRRHRVAALLPLIADAEKRAAAAAMTEEREAAYWKVMDAADVWMSHDKRARASVVCDFLMDLGNDIKRGRPFRRPVAYAAALDPAGAASGETT